MVAWKAVSNLLARAVEYVDRGLSSVARRRDIQKDDLVGADLVVRLGDLYGIARVYKIYKVYALYHPALVDIQAGNDAFGKHMFYPLYFSIAVFKSIAPL